MLRIRVGDFKLGKKEENIIKHVLDIGRLSEGVKVREFEEKWAEFIGTKYCVVVNSGTSALIAGLHALKYLFKIKDKAKVITSPLTFIATVNAIVTSGLQPLFADVDRETFVIKPEDIERIARKEDEAAIILPVHLMGYPADMARINEIAKRYNLLVMEDAAQAHGTFYKNKKLGTYSVLACFSFYIAHNVQAGEMGAVVTDNYEVYKLIKKIKAHGRMCDCPVCTRSEGKCPRLNAYKGEEDFDPRFYHDIVGFNFKAMEFQAALGLVQLENVENILEKRKANVAYLNQGLMPFSNILQLPKYSQDISYLAYPLVIKDPGVISRRVLRQKLEESGIETRPLFGCIPTQQPAYAYLKEKYKGKLPNAEYIGANGFYIGCHQYLKKSDLDFIISIFHKIFKGIK
ncbi:MAG: DegT/DnrJ/EryC1/StrS family aminotransferase [Candidatus Omnitrophica bacterium]|nr:DegT/DnrJ/EryC1/StrS family aminotransferase [Candidatus Omnitrophota bacterium]